jgi:hypothetical protein
MNAFRVWVRPLDYGFVVCVDGMDNALWLLDQMSESFVFRSAEPINQEQSSTLCTFQVPSDPRLSLSRLRKLLLAIPEVILLKVAAAN